MLRLSSRQQLLGGLAGVDKGSVGEARAPPRRGGSAATGNSGLRIVAQLGLLPLRSSLAGSPTQSPPSGDSAIKVGVKR